MRRYRNISLTPIGKRYGCFLVWRDNVLKQFFRTLDAGAGVDEQVEGIEHYITPHTMSLISGLLNYFKAHPERLEELRATRNDSDYPLCEDLGRLRAWEFRHNRDDA